MSRFPSWCFECMRRSFFILFFLVVSLSRATLVGGPEMIPLGPYGGDVRSLVVHPGKPERFFLGTADGQIFISEDAGKRWRKLAPGLGRRGLVVDNLVFHPKDPNTLYAAAWELKSDKGWLFRTRDGGTSWQNLSLGSYQRTIRALAIAPSDPDVIAVGISEGVLQSTDGGMTWDRITRGYRSLYNVESLAFDPHHSQTLYVGTFHLGWKTTNGGKKWQAIHTGMIHDSDLFSFLVHPEQPTVLYSSACTGVYKSTNAGLRWTRLKNGLPKKAKRTRSLHLAPSDPNTIYAGTTVGLFVSEDAGKSWRQLLSDVVVNSVAVDPRTDRVILVGTDDAGILKSEEGGNRFLPSNQGFVHRKIAALEADPRDSYRYYASVLFDQHYGGFFLSEDDGRSWDRFNKGLDSGSDEIRTILPARHSHRVFLGTSSGLFSGFPLQKPWKPVESTRDLAIFDLDFSDGREGGLFLATAAGIFHLDLRGNRLEKLVIPVYRGKIHAILSDESSHSLFAGTDVGVFRSRDRGKTWTTKAKGLPDSPVHLLEKIEGKLFCGTRKGLFSSDNGGEEWSLCQGIDPIDIVAMKSNPMVAGQVTAADFLSGHLFRSEDAGTTWKVLKPQSPGPRIATLAFGLSGRLLAGTASDGICLIQSTGQATKTLNQPTTHSRDRSQLRNSN